MATLVGTYAVYGEQSGSTEEADLLDVMIQPLYGGYLLVTDITGAAEGETWIFLAYSADNGGSWEHKHALHLPSAGSFSQTLKQPLRFGGSVDDNGVEQTLIKLTYIQPNAVLVTATIHGWTTKARTVVPA